MVTKLYGMWLMEITDGEIGHACPVLQYEMEQREEKEKNGRTTSTPDQNS
jgi:hypothetical protein